MSAPASQTRFGTAHPEKVENPLWLRAIQEDWRGHQLREHLGLADSAPAPDPMRYSDSRYREHTPGPFWSWQRFGRTSTLMPDGRIIHIAGEHEDSYDVEFCIYNDVVVEHPGGAREIYLYPQAAFPPTDFHSATRVGNAILLIGSLGYKDLRRVGETQVLMLDPSTLRFKAVQTHGDDSGWISRHAVERIDETHLLVIGGMLQTENDYVANTDIFVLDLIDMWWRRRAHADTTLFPVPAAVYQAYKNPRRGTANPERTDNPFWQAMLQRQWLPSRARLHYGDFAPPRPELVPSQAPRGADEAPPAHGTPQGAAYIARISADLERSKLHRTIDDVVWTAVRDDPLRVTLNDGRALAIGGTIHDYDVECADAFIYNDLIVTHPDGRTDIFTYAEEDFPEFVAMAGALHADHLFIFGILDRERHPSRSRGPLVLWMNTQTYRVTPVDAIPPTARVWMYVELDDRDGDRVVFPITRDRTEDPIMAIAFDLSTLTWGDPFPGS